MISSRDCYIRENVMMRTGARQWAKIWLSSFKSNCLVIFVKRHQSMTWGVVVMELLTLIARLVGLEAHRKQAIQRASTRYAGPLHIRISKHIYVVERGKERRAFHMHS